jgi:hypothetical protein
MIAGACVGKIVESGVENDIRIDFEKDARVPLPRRPMPTAALRACRAELARRADRARRAQRARSDRRAHRSGVAADERRARAG